MDQHVFELCDQHDDGSSIPPIRKLMLHHNELGTLFKQITGINNERHLPEIRNKFLLEAMPLLPRVSCDSKNFICRWTNATDLQIYNYFSSNPFRVVGSFMSFFLNGPRCGVTNSADANCELICEDFGAVKKLGFLSEVSAENEVLIEEGRMFIIQEEFIGINSLLRAEILRTSSANNFYRNFENNFLFDNRRYIYVSEIETG